MKSAILDILMLVVGAIKTNAQKITSESRIRSVVVRATIGEKFSYFCSSSQIISLSEIAFVYFLEPKISNIKSEMAIGALQ